MMELAKASDFFNNAIERRYDAKHWEGIGKVRIQSLSELERKQWQLANLDADGNLDLSKVPMSGPLLITFTAVDDQGKKIFTRNQAQQLAQIDSKILGPMVDWIQEHCGLDNLDVEETVGNSEGIQSDDSP